MRILHVAPSIEQGYGGPTQSLSGYVSASVLAGCEVHVAAPRGADRDRERLQNNGAASVREFGSSGGGGSVRSPSLVRWIESAAPSFDIIHVHGLFNSVSTLSARAAIRSGGAVVIRPFGTLSRYTFEHRRTALKKFWFNLLERQNLIAASGIHFTTNTERDEAGWHNLSLAAKAHVVPPPYLASGTLQQKDPRAAGSNVLFVGRLNPVKNLEALIDAWPMVVSAAPHARLVIAGSGSPGYAESLKQRVLTRGAGETISFAGFLSPAERDQALAEATVFVLPSLHENFGVAALEALAAGVPVVFSPEVQLADFVVANGLGVVTDVSPSRLAIAIVDALSNHALRGRVAEKGRNMVNDAFGVEAIGLRLSSMYLAVREDHAKHARRTIS